MSQTPSLDKCSERDRMVIELYLKGVPTREIAEKANIDRSTIYRILRRCGLEPTRKRPRRSKEITEDEEREIVEEYKRGVPVHEILEKHNISSTKLYSILEKYGLRRIKRRKGGTRRPLTPEEEERIVELYKSGRSVYSIAKELKRAPSTVYTVLKRRGLLKG